jgi:methionine aminopeptidase
MASQTDAERQAAALNAALDAIEASLDALSPGARPDEIARALAEPVRAFDAVAKEALA